jgi:ParB family chromosome partitioning protein
VISGGHARTLLAIDDPQLLLETADLVEEEGLSVRVVERLVPLVNGGADPRAALAAIIGSDGRSPFAGTSTDAGSAGSDTEGLIADEGEDRRVSGDRPGDDGDQPGGGTPRKSVEMREIEQHLIERLGSRVVVNGSNDRGRIEITYLSMDDLDRIVELILSE